MRIIISKDAGIISLVGSLIVGSPERQVEGNLIVKFPEHQQHNVALDYATSLVSVAQCKPTKMAIQRQWAGCLFDD